MSRFADKVVLITGGTSGIGLAGARRIADEGGRVLVTGRDEARIEAARRFLPPDAVLIRDDAASPASGEALAEVVRRIGRLDGLWLNAGYAAVSAVEEVDADFFDRMMSANVRGPMLQMAALSGLMRQGGSVLLTASTSAYEKAPIASVYAATKGAMISMARCWAASFGDRAIRVNTLVPGPIDTSFRDFMAEDLRRGFESGVVEQLALKRVGSAGEAAAVALFLLSDEASYVTGSQYAVDGGLTMR